MTSSNLLDFLRTNLLDFLRTLVSVEATLSVSDPFWHTWLAWKVSPFLSPGDLISYLGASDGVAHRLLRLASRRRLRGYAHRLHARVRALPLLGPPVAATAATAADVAEGAAGAVAGAVAARGGPLYHAALARLPVDLAAVALWGTAAARAAGALTAARGLALAADVATAAHTRALSLLPPALTAVWVHATKLELREVDVGVSARIAGGDPVATWSTLQYGFESFVKG
jgi:hypothetical protein